MVKLVSDKIGVMYLGTIVEYGESTVIYKNHLHPYTKLLFAAVPVPDPEIEYKRWHELIKGEVPSPVNPPPGCKFQSRCPRVMDKCRKQSPDMKEIIPGHYVACYLY